MPHADTIVALATPPGKSGVAVVRVSGPQADAAALAMTSVALPSPRTAALRALKQDGRIIEPQSIMLRFPSPTSFTGEDIVEFHIHGGRAVIAAVLTALLAQPGLRLAEPGEFSRRAFDNGKLDLTQVEGLADLIDAEGRAQLDQAARQMRGLSEQFYGPLRETVLRCLAHLEAYLDFPDEDIPDDVLGGIECDIAAAIARIEAQLDAAPRHRRVREGLHIALFGAPNAGKSSILNRLAEREAAIVSEIPGTTRDAIELHLDLGGYAAILVDTAGLRESADPLEREGMRRTAAALAEADIRLQVVDATSPAPASGDADAVLWNKTDIAGATMPDFPLPAFAVSAQTGSGFDDLLAWLAARCAALCASQEPPVVTRLRHQHALATARDELRHGLAASELVLRAEHLRRAMHAIGSITGHVHVEDLLDEIFRRFCIGK